MPKPGWYVVQVQTGREQKMCDLVLRISEELDLATDYDEPLLQECFSPQFKTRRKYDGQWIDKELRLLPGYVVCVTAYPDELRQRLRSVPEFTRLLTMGETFVPLRDDERAWIDEWTTKGDRTVPLSFAHKQGDKLVVTEGPLKGREGIITRVNRRKCLAFLELHVAGKKIATTVGLAIVPESERGTTE